MDVLKANVDMPRLGSALVINISKDTKIGTRHFLVQRF